MIRAYLLTLAALPGLLLAATVAFAAPQSSKLPLENAIKLADQQVPQGQWRQLDLPPLPARPGKVTVLRFRAVIVTRGAGGCNFNASVRLNGHPLTRFTAFDTERLIGRNPMLELLSNKQVYPVFSGPNLMIMFAPNADRGDTMTGGGLGATFVLDIADVARGVDGNTLAFHNNFPGKVAAGYGQLRITDLALGWVDKGRLPQPVSLAPRRAPIPGGLQVGKLGLVQSRRGGFVVRLPGGPDLLVETALGMKPDAPAVLVADNTAPAPPGVSLTTDTAGKNGYRLTATWPGLRLDRTVTLQDGLVVWRETWTNTGPKPRGVPFRHRFFFRGQDAQFYIGGSRDNGVVADSPSNPTLFMQVRHGAGAGITEESDWLRLLSGMRGVGGVGEIYSQWLALQPGAHIDFNLTITPVSAGGGYWAFINSVRRRWGMNHTTMARPLFWGYAHATGATPAAAAVKALGHLGPIYLAIGPWQRLEPDARTVTAGRYPRLPAGAPRAPGGCPDFDVKAFLTFAHRQPYWQQVGKEVALLHAAVPNVKVIQMLHPAMEAVYKPLEDRWPIAADAIRTANGKIFEDAHYDRSWLDDMVTKGWAVLYYVPRPGSAQLKAILSGMDRAMDQYHLDGIYSDEFSWAGLQRGYSRYDYSRSDGYSADLDDQGHVLRMKSDNAYVTQTAQQEMIGAVLKRGKFFLGNGGNVLRSIFALPIQRFIEGGNGPNYWPQGHLSATPLVLGNMGDRTSLQGVFDSVKTCLAHGCLYSPTAVNLLLHGPDNFVCKQYPITVQEIGPGWVIGKERLVTIVGRSFNWPPRGGRVKLYRYDSHGTRLDAGAAAVSVKAGQPLSLQAPPGGLVIAELSD